VAVFFFSPVQAYSGFFWFFWFFWQLVDFQGRPRIVDTLFGSGFYAYKTYGFQPQFDSIYFAAHPEILRTSHLPFGSADSASMQRVPSPVHPEEFASSIHVKVRTCFSCISPACENDSSGTCTLTFAVKNSSSPVSSQPLALRYFTRILTPNTITLPVREDGLAHIDFATYGLPEMRITSMSVRNAKFALKDTSHLIQTWHLSNGFFAHRALMKLPQGDWDVEISFRKPVPKDKVRCLSLLL
jgi:hypothetical protein